MAKKDITLLINVQGDAQKVIAALIAQIKSIDDAISKVAINTSVQSKKMADAIAQTTAGQKSNTKIIVQNTKVLRNNITAQKIVRLLL